MDGKRPGNINYAANPELEGLSTGQVMDRWGVGVRGGGGVITTVIVAPLCPSIAGGVATTATVQLSKG